MWEYFEHFLSFIFPIRCIICRSSESRLCTSCLSSFPKVFDVPHPWILSVYHYQNQHVRKSIHALKYRHDTELVKIFALQCKERLEEYLIEKIAFEKRPVTLVPVPMTKKRLRIRKQQTSMKLAEAMRSQLLTEASVNNKLIKKILEKQPQREIQNKTLRLRNLLNAFRADTADPRALYVLVDDVTTTGATLLECRRALIHAGAKDVIAITVAH